MHRPPSKQGGEYNYKSLFIRTGVLGEREADLFYGLGFGALISERFKFDFGILIPNLPVSKDTPKLSFTFRFIMPKM